MKRLFILSIAFTVCLGMALGTLLYVSLLPYFKEIGIAATILVMVGIGCAAILLVTFTYTKACVMVANRNHSRLMSRVIQFGDSGAAALDYQGQWVHLSSVHEQAKVPLPQTVIQQLPIPKKTEPYADRETVLELFNVGNSLREIAERTGVSYYNVQKWTSEAKKAVKPD